MREIVTYLDRLREIAIDQHGFVSMKQAVRDGIPKTELPKLLSRGRLERVAHGVYRVPQVAATQWDFMALAVLWTGVDEACISHESALHAWGVNDILPNQVHVTVAKKRRIRRKHPDNCYVVHHQDLGPRQIGWFEQIPITTLPQTIADCIDYGTPTYLLRQAIERGGRTSLLLPQERDRLERELEKHDL